MPRSALHYRESERDENRASPALCPVPLSQAREKNRKKLAPCNAEAKQSRPVPIGLAYEHSGQPSSAIAGPSLLAGVCRRATRSTAFPTPQGFKWGFVIPPKMAAGKTAIRLDEIVARQRRMQLLSVLLTVSAALGLAFLYRDILIGPASRRSSEPIKEPACRDSTRSQHRGATQKTLDEENHT
jgi:hypothetical protein